MTLQYRTAVPSDAERLVAMFHNCFCDTFGHLYKAEDLALFLDSHSPDGWRNQLECENVTARLVEDGNELAGFIKIGPLSLPVETPREAIELRQLYVLEPWQGSGAARALMDWVMAEAGRRGANEVYLSVFTDNHRARRFYARYGFEEVGPYAFMVGNQADADVILRLVL